MRKQEYLHLHALFVEVAKHLIEEEDMSQDVLAAYKSIDTKSAWVHASKEEHHEAMLVLASDLKTQLEDVEAERPELTPDVVSATTDQSSRGSERTE